MLRSGQTNQIDLVDYVQGAKKNELNLKKEEIVDADLPQIIEFLAAHPEIDTVDLNGNKITDKGLQVFAGQKNLFSLDVSNNPKVTLQGIEQLWRDEKNVTLFDVYSEHVDALERAYFETLRQQKSQSIPEEDESEKLARTAREIFDKSIDELNRINHAEKQAEVALVVQLRKTHEELKEQKTILDVSEAKAAEVKIARLSELKSNAHAEIKQVEAKITIVRTQIKNLTVEQNSGSAHQKIVDATARLDSGRTLMQSHIDQAQARVQALEAEIETKKSEIAKARFATKIDSIEVAKLEGEVKQLAEKYAKELSGSDTQKKTYGELKQAQGKLQKARSSFDKANAPVLAKEQELKLLEPRLQPLTEDLQRVVKEKQIFEKEAWLALETLKEASKDIGRKIATLTQQEVELRERKDHLQVEVAKAISQTSETEEKTKTAKIARAEKITVVGMELKTASIRANETKAKIKFDNIKQFMAVTWDRDKTPEHIQELQAKLVEIEAKGNYEAGFKEFLAFARTVALTAPLTQAEATKNFLNLFSEKQTYLVTTFKYFSPDDTFLTNSQAEAIVRNYIDDIEKMEFGIRVDSLLGSDKVTTAAGERKTLPSHMATQYRDFQKAVQLAQEKNTSVNYIDLLKTIKMRGIKAVMNTHAWRKDPATERYELCLPGNAKAFNERYSTPREPAVKLDRADRAPSPSPNSGPIR